jgi:hypothetical protein
MQNHQAMKSGLIIVIVVFLLIFTGNAGANYYPKAISDNDTMLIIINKNLEDASLNTFYNASVKNKYLAALPDTTHDIIIIFRNNDRSHYVMGLAEGTSQKQVENVMITKPAVSIILKG